MDKGRSNKPDSRGRAEAGTRRPGDAVFRLQRRAGMGRLRRARSRWPGPRAPVPLTPGARRQGRGQKKDGRGETERAGRLPNRPETLASHPAARRGRDTAGRGVFPAPRRQFRKPRGPAGSFFGRRSPRRASWFSSGVDRGPGGGKGERGPLSGERWTNGAEEKNKKERKETHRQGKTKGRGPAGCFVCRALGGRQRNSTTGQDDHGRRRARR